MKINITFSYFRVKINECQKPHSPDRLGQEGDELLKGVHITEPHVSSISPRDLVERHGIFPFVRLQFSRIKAICVIVEITMLSLGANTPTVVHKHTIFHRTEIMEW